MQTKTGSSNNAWMDYTKACAQNYMETKELKQETTTTINKKGKAATQRKPQ